MPEVRIIGPGRAGRALAAALGSAGWSVAGLLGRADPIAGAAAGVDLLVIATPDASVPTVASAVEPEARCVVAHLSGSLGLDALAPHPRRASLHPLRSIAEPATSLAGAWFAVAGDALVAEVVEDVGGRALHVAEEDRPAYHAAAVIAANHLVALLGQVERVAAAAGVPFEAYLELVRGAVDNVERVGARAALTGPVARGDWDTVRAHLDALHTGERAAYAAMARAAAQLAGRDIPPAIWDATSPASPVADLRPAEVTA